MFRFDESLQSDAVEFVPDSGDIHAERIVVNIEPVVPEIIYNIVSRADSSGVLKQITENF